MCIDSVVCHVNVFCFIVDEDVVVLWLVVTATGNVNKSVELEARPGPARHTHNGRHTRQLHIGVAALCRRMAQWSWSIIWSPERLRFSFGMDGDAWTM